MNTTDEYNGGKFPGFRMEPIKNTHGVICWEPEVFDKTPREVTIYGGLLTQSEKVVLHYLIRHTIGFHDDSKAISTNEFMQGRWAGRRPNRHRMDDGTGLCRPTVIAAVRGLTEKGFIEEIDDERLWTTKKIYRLRCQGGRPNDRTVDKPTALEGSFGDPTSKLD